MKLHTEHPKKRRPRAGEVLTQEEIQPSFNERMGIDEVTKNRIIEAFLKLEISEFHREEHLINDEVQGLWLKEIENLLFLFPEKRALIFSKYSLDLIIRLSKKVREKEGDKTEYKTEYLKHLIYIDRTRAQKISVDTDASINTLETLYKKAREAKVDLGKNTGTPEIRKALEFYQLVRNKLRETGKYQELDPAVFQVAKDILVYYASNEFVEASVAPTSDVFGKKGWKPFLILAGDLIKAAPSRQSEVRQLIQDKIPEIMFALKAILDNPPFWFGQAAGSALAGLKLLLADEVRLSDSGMVEAVEKRRLDTATPPLPERSLSV